jgi:hypothetical protein
MKRFARVSLLFLAFVFGFCAVVTTLSVVESQPAIAGPNP